MSPPAIINRAAANSLALETTLLLHGVPRGEGAPLAAELAKLTNHHGAAPAYVGVFNGTPTVALSDAELRAMLDAPDVAKANAANLGLLIHRKQHAATTVATTMELAAFTRFPVAVVASGVKSLLDVAATRELLETLGIPVVGYRTDRFPAFYLRDLGPHGPAVDARFDDLAPLAAFVHAELERTGRGVVVANPIPPEAELPKRELDAWVSRATTEAQSRSIHGRAITPFVLGELHRISGGATLRANLALVRSNVALGAQLAARLASLR